MKNLIISKFKSQYTTAFYKLNKAWIIEFWQLEDSDLNNLLNPKNSIIDIGGEIFFAIYNNEVIGTAAMIPSSKIGFYELAKMTVHEKYRGLGVSKKLLDACINFAVKKNAVEIFLISNRLLLVARKLYDRYGFQEVDLDSKKYVRGDVKMKLAL